MNALSVRQLRFLPWVAFTLFHFAFSAESPKTFDLNFRPDHQRTIFTVSGSNLAALKILNTSPDSKIILKLTHPEAFPPNEARKIVRFPRLSSITSIRVTPIDAGNDLLIIRLAEKLAFSHPASGTSNTIEIADSPYHQPLERDYRMGLYFQKKDDLGAALNLYRRVVFKNRKHPYAYFKAGQIRLKWNQFRLAEINFQHAVSNGSDSTGLYREMANLFRRKGNMRLANSYQSKYEKLSRKQPQTAAAKDFSAVSQPILTQIASNTGQETKRQQASDGVKTAGNGPEATTAGTPKMPKKIIFYLIGIAFSGIFLMATLLRNLLRRKRLPFSQERPIGRTPVEVENSPVPIQRQKRRFMHLPGKIIEKREPTESPANRFSGSKNSHPILLENLPVRLPETAENFELTDSAVPAGSGFPSRETAKELNLGLGEVELALNLTSEQRRQNQDRNIRDRIYALHFQKQTIPEIARSLNLGQDEVELILQFTNQNQTIE